MQWFSAIARDVRQALRVLRSAPVFAITAILTLALGIGANTAVFSVVNAVLFRPLPVSDADRLVVLASARAPSPALRGLSYPELEDYRAAAGSVLEPMAGYTVGFAGLAPEHGSPARVLVTWVTGGYFSLLGIAPAAGRPIEERDVARGRASPIVVLGYDSWRSRFGADPSIVGRKVLVNGEPCTIVGVAPRGFRGTFAFSNPEIYLPLRGARPLWSSDDVFSDRASRGLHTLSRLRPGVSLAQANALLDAVARRLEREHPGTNTGVRVTAISERFARPEEDNARSNAFGATIILLLVALVLFAAQVNVMNLLLARAASRRRELAIRVAVGASRGRLVRQLAVETALLTIVGGIAGLLLAWWITSALSAARLVPGDLPARLDFGVDTRVLAYGFVLTCFTAVTVGILTAVRASRVNVDAALRGLRAESSSLARRRDLRTILVVIQTAACFVLLVASAMFTRSLREARHIDLGFDPRGVLNAQMDVAQVGYTGAQGRALFDEVERRVRRLPGVEDLSYACTVPLGYVRLGSRVAAQGSAVGADRLTAGMNIVGPRYFHVMRIPILRGRAFDEGDDQTAPRVAIINPQLATALWPGSDPIGRRFVEAAGDPPLQVVGVVAASKYRLLFEEPQPYFYVPLAQHDAALRVLHVRTSLASPDSLASDVERIVREVEPALPLYDVQTMTSALNSGYGFFLVRTAALSSLALAALAALLAIVGLYGVVSCTVAERSREIGIRLALGATTGNIARMVMADGALLAAAGAIVGAAAAMAVARIIARLLFGIAPTDPLSFAAAAACLAIVTLIAGSLPAVRAMSTDPIASLRE